MPRNRTSQSRIALGINWSAAAESTDYLDSSCTANGSWYRNEERAGMTMVFTVTPYYVSGYGKTLIGSVEYKFRSVIIITHVFMQMNPWHLLTSTITSTVSTVSEKNVTLKSSMTERFNVFSKLHMFIINSLIILNKLILYLFISLHEDFNSRLSCSQPFLVI